MTYEPEHARPPAHPTTPFPTQPPTQQVPAEPYSKPVSVQPWAQPVPPYTQPVPVAGQVVPYQHPGHQVPPYAALPPVVAVVQAPGTKETVVAYLLWFFLGGVGGDRFYLGRTGEGITMLILWLIGWATVWFFVGGAFFLVVGFWATVNAFRIPADVRDCNARAVAALYGYR